MMRTENASPFRENIINKIRILAAALVAGISIAAQAQATDDTPYTHWKLGYQVGVVQDHGDSEPAGQLSVGYDFNSTWGVEALANFSLLFERDGGLANGDHQFNQAYGVRALATLPMSDRWKLVGGLGVVQSNSDIGTATSHYTATKTGPLVSVAAMYQPNRHWSMGVEAASFTASHLTSIGLRGEVHF